MKKRRKAKKKPFAVLILVILIVFGIYYLINKSSGKNKTETRYLASIDEKISLQDKEGKDKKDVYRGIKVDYFINQDKDDVAKIKIDNEEYFVNKKYLVNDIKDTVLEKEVYVRTSYNLNKDLDSVDLLGLAKKGEKLEIIGFDKLDSQGVVNMYKVKLGDEEGYFYQKYTLNSEEEAKKDYDYNGALETHKKQKNVYGGGDGASLDYYPVEKPKFENNKMPEECYTLYLNGTKSVMNDIDSYISLAKSTKINAFVVDIIDDVNIAYVSPYMEKECPTCNKHAQNSLDNYKAAIKKLKDNGFYVIGRITAFKNTYYVTDHKENAITNSSGSPLLHQSSLA
jgi:hypothetical protein